MANVRDLLDIPITYDIIVSDFGRDATIEYLRLAAISEKRLIMTILDRHGHEFFDEYRRIMFTTLGDLAFVKRDEIARVSRQHGYLTKDVLIGLGASLSQEFAERMTLGVIQEIQSALDRGYEQFRVIIPCNRLSDLANEIVSTLKDKDEMQRIISSYTMLNLDVKRIASAPIEACTVVDEVMTYIAKKKLTQQGQHISALILGTSDVNAIYSSRSSMYGVNILALASNDFQLIDDAIVASIGGSSDKVNSAIDKLRRNIIHSREKNSDDFIVVEACTDFSLGLGVSSIAIFAEASVAKCYGLDPGND